MIGDQIVSASHAGDLTLAVAGPEIRGPLGCDIEPVEARPAAVWRDLLGRRRHKLVDVVADSADEDEDTAATRVWVATECLRKAGAAIDTPLIFSSVNADGWVLFSTGSLVTATYVAQLQTAPNPLVVAVLMRYDYEARL